MAMDESSTDCNDPLLIVKPNVRQNLDQRQIWPSYIPVKDGATIKGKSCQLYL